MKDRQIVDLFWARSEEALRALDEAYGGLCRSLALNILNDRRDAEECVNDAYLGLWRAIPPARPDPLRSYLCRVVRNVSLNAYYKKRAARRSAAGCVAFEELEECLAGADEAVQTLETKELARSVEAFLDTLSREDRVIFLRRYWFADSCRQIAGRVGLSEKNVTVRLARMRRKLKERLAGEGVSV